MLLFKASPFNVEELAKRYGIVTVLDASLLQDNLYFIKTREESMKDKSIREITRMIADLYDIIYFSGRKFGFARGGGILVRDEELFHSMEDLIPMFEGFLTCGGMSVKEMEAMTVGFDESMDMDVISQGPQFIKYCVDQLDAYGVPVITPGGGLGAHLDASQFVSHIPQQEYPAGALVCAMYICGGIRGMERGTCGVFKTGRCPKHPEYTDEKRIPGGGRLQFRRPGVVPDGQSERRAVGVRLPADRHGLYGAA